MTGICDFPLLCKFSANGETPRRRQAVSGGRRRKPVVKGSETTIAQPQRQRQVQAPQSIVLNRYRLIRRLGSGAFGVVWLAHDEQLDRVVAVKRIEAHDPEMAARAEREAIAAARLSHPGIVALHEAGRDAEAVYLVSELVRGKTLRERLLAGELSDRDVVRIGIALCDALAHAHTRGVVHRDIKPANILIPDRPDGESGIVKLTDFGVALIAGDDALTRTGDVVGTLAYMAPEQADGRPVSGQSDLYSLALVIYEALSGVNPIRAAGAAATARRVGTRLPAISQLRSDLPPAIGDAVDWAVQPEELARGTLADLREGLIEALDQTGTTAGTIDASVIESYEQLEQLDDDEQQLISQAPRLTERLVAAAAAGACAAGLMLALASAPLAFPPLWVALACAVAVGLLPRAGTLIAALALTAVLVAANANGWAVLLWAALLPTVLLTPRDGADWWLPVTAPLLGLLGLALAFPALAGLAAPGRRRAAIAGLGFWWLALAEPIASGRLLLGQLPLSADWAASPTAAFSDVVVALIGHGVPIIALVWAAAAWLLPTITASGRIAIDLCAVLLWASSLTIATVVLAGALGWPLSAAPTAVLVAGTALAALVALAAAALRPGGPEALPTRNAEPSA